MKYENDIQNLEKYWNYRNRLNENFIFSSDNDEPGSNIPVDRIVKSTKLVDGKIIIDDNIHSFIWDDCNGTLPHYIMLLATEYKLLKKYSNNNNDNLVIAKNTLHELENAIKALKRLDRYVGGVENGAIRRTDVLYVEKRTSDEELGNWKPLFDHFDTVNNNKKANLRFAEKTSYNQAMYNSIDNVIKLSEAEAVVRELLSDEGDDALEISNLLYDEIKKMIENTYHPDEPRKTFNRNKIATHKGFMQRSWYLKDPDTENELLSEGKGGAADLYTFVTSYGLAKSAKRFNINAKGINLSKIFFKLLMKMKLKKISNSFWMIRSLIAVNNISKKPYNFLKNADKQYSKKLEQYPLIWSILNNNDSISDNDRIEIVNLLSIAPENGPRNHLYDDENDNRCYFYDVYEWSCPNRFVWVELNGNGGTTDTGWKRHGEFSGIDYMVLHNLYWLTKNDTNNIYQNK